MSYVRILSGVSEDRELFVLKVYREMESNALVNTPDEESRKAYFLQLVEGNEELSEVEKRYCREKFIYDFELNNAVYKLCKPRECDKCQTTRYSNKYYERCISIQ